MDTVLFLHGLRAFALMVSFEHEYRSKETLHLDMFTKVERWISELVFLFAPYILRNHMRAIRG
jgi:hypothetical protein